MSWAEIARLRAAGTPERTVQDVVRAHGLDLPHLPAIRLGRQPASGLRQWEVYCQACALNHGPSVTSCLLGMYEAPAYLVDPEPIRRVVDMAHTASRAASHAIADGEAGRHRGVD